MIEYDHKTLRDRWARTESRLARTLVGWPARVTPVAGSGYAAFYSSDWTMYNLKLCSANSIKNIGAAAVEALKIAACVAELLYFGNLRTQHR